MPGTTREPDGFFRASAWVRSIAIGRDDRQRRGWRSQAAGAAARDGGRLERVCGASNGRTARRTLGAIQAWRGPAGYRARPGDAGARADARSRAHLRARAAGDTRARAGTANHQSSRQRAAGDHAAVRRIPDRHGLSPRTAPEPARRGVFLLELHRQPPARRHAGLALRARGHDADADRPQPGRDADDESAAGSRRQLGRPDRGLESAHGRARRPVRHRRSRDRCSATGRRAPSSLRDRARDRERHARAARPVGDAVAAAERPGHGRRVHRVLHRVGPARRQLPRFGAEQPLPARLGRPRSAT